MKIAERRFSKMKSSIISGIFLLNLCNFMMAIDISSEFAKTGIIPDVLISAPSNFLKVVFEDKELNFGEELTPTEVKDAPKITWSAEAGSFYTLALVDPDAPTRQDPKFGQVLHWLVTNIPGSNVSDGTTIAEHIGSGPPQGTGLHRYIFLLYKQPEKLTFDEKHISNRSREGRLKFTIKNFADKYNLGNPVAGNMYQAQWDDYVPILQQQLGGAPKIN